MKTNNTYDIAVCGGFAGISAAPAKADGYTRTHISTTQTGLYKRYGYTFFK